MKKPTWSRREFLEMGAAAAGVSLATKPLKFRAVAPSDTVRFGMVGIGMQGSGLLGTAVSLPGVTCAAAADLYDGRHTLAKEIAGAVTLVATADQVIHLDATGNAVLNPSAAMRTDSIFWIASMSKPILATLLLMLQDEELLRALRESEQDAKRGRLTSLQDVRRELGLA